jgi:hypothetical protein
MQLLDVRRFGTAGNVPMTSRRKNEATPRIPQIPNSQNNITDDGQVPFFGTLSHWHTQVHSLDTLVVVIRRKYRTNMAVFSSLLLVGTILVWMIHHRTDAWTSPRRAVRRSTHRPLITPLSSQLPDQRRYVCLTRMYSAKTFTSTRPYFVRFDIFPDAL